MRLFAAILPPREVLEEVRRVVQSVNDPEPAPDSGQRGLKKLFGGGRQAPATTAAPAETTVELDAPPLDRMYLPITGFGNVTEGDSVRLAKALRDEVAGWRRPELVFAGGAALEFPGDQSVWVKIDGDVDDLRVIGRGVPAVVQRLGFFVDRRVFRPWLSVGTITDATTAPYLERLVAALDELRGDPWVAESVSLMRWLPIGATDGFEEMERMPLA